MENLIKLLNEAVNLGLVRPPEIPFKSFDIYFEITCTNPDEKRSVSIRRNITGFCTITFYINDENLPALIACSNLEEKALLYLSEFYLGNQTLSNLFKKKDK